VDLGEFLAESGLEGLRRSGDGYVARCPAHQDRTPSLSIRQGDDGRVLLHCWAGCGTEAVLDALGLEWGDLFPLRPRSRRRR
jgi:hypothetical protein